MLSRSFFLASAAGLFLLSACGPAEEPEPMDPVVPEDGDDVAPEPTQQTDTGATPEEAR